ncbi:linear amide C-N hydrolase [Providencia sp. PROV130]|uniref:linear amide C-N hydrolase n=1 Tax=Providencia sp. PROV130 TaxID=2949840 RepID=UPI00234950C0|nr:linear amide C-N hydrolase [Providencia sp. PROV130]
MCTSLSITDSQNNIYQGRTLELTEDLPSWITYYPANTFFQKKAPNGENGIKYTSKFDILAITTEVYFDGDNHNIFQGLNSAGLTFSANMISEAELTPINPENYCLSLPVTALGEWALSLFSHVDEVKKAVENGYFWSPILVNFRNLTSPFHYAFYDKHGGSIIVEAVNGKLQVFDNPTRVMTNGPDFQWHLKNLNNYTQLSNLDISTNLLGNIRVTQPDSGIATSNLPSSDTSVGRFIRAVFYSTYAPKVGNAKDAMITLAHIINNFDRTKNITVDNMGEGESTQNSLLSEYTVWSCLSDLSNGVMYIRGYGEMNYNQYSISQFSSAGKPVFQQLNIY